MNAITTIDYNTPATTLDQWAAQGEQLAADHKNLMWKIAAWLEHGVSEFGDAAERIALEQFGRSRAQIKKAMDVAKRFPEDQRRPELSYAHHAIVMAVDSEQASKLLDEAIMTNASANSVKKAVKQIRESQGGDIFQQMANANEQELIDDWNAKIVRLFNRCPNGVEGRQEFIEQANEVNGGIIYN